MLQHAVTELPHKWKRNIEISQPQQTYGVTKVKSFKIFVGN